MNDKGQKIRVVPDTLNNLVVAVAKGQYRIPQFQREYVWSKSKVVELFDSIYQEFPIGSFFLWKAGRQHNGLFRHSVNLGVPVIQADDDISFILDGQQRITSLYVTLMGLTVDDSDYSRICFDTKEEGFTHRAPDESRFISVSDIWNKNLISIAKKIDESRHDALGKCSQVLKTYPVSIIEVRDKDLPAVCKIFQRINQGGKRLDRFDLISAITFTTDFDLRQKFKGDIVAKLSATGFVSGATTIAPAIVTQLMALLKKGACTESAEFSLTSTDIQGLWKTVVDSILLAADALRKNLGVKNNTYLPYDAQLTLLAYFFAKSGKRALSDTQLKWAAAWFWRSAFTQHYGSGGPTKMGRDKELFDALMDDRTPSFEPAMNLTAQGLIDTWMTQTGSAIRNAFLCLLAHRNPVHLANNGALDLIGGQISDFTSAQKHHIFPQGFLKGVEIGSTSVHALPNFCFLPAELNNRINDSQPSKYFPQLRQENPNFEVAAATHLLPSGAESGIADDDYLKFLTARAAMLMEEVERVTGISTAPTADQRHQAVVQLETRLRNLIHGTLVNRLGPQYWKTNVPGDVQDEVEKKIASEIRKNPEIGADRFNDAREKLNFCNVPDYLKIIVGKANWLHFEPTFRSQQAFQKHLTCFSDFRNAVMHNREITEVSRLEGQAALAWLSGVLNAKPSGVIDSSDAD